MSIAMVDNSQVSFPPPQPQKSPMFFSWKRRGETGTRHQLNHMNGFSVGKGLTPFKEGNVRKETEGGKREGKRA